MIKIGKSKFWFGGARFQFYYLLGGNTSATGYGPGTPPPTSATGLEQIKTWSNDYPELFCVVHSQKRYRLVASCKFYRLVATCQQVATSLSISSSCNKSVKIRLVASCHLQTCYNLFETSCNKPVEVITLQQVC